MDWQKRFFPQIEEHFGSDLTQDIFGICRHIAQHNTSPKFFDFEERDKHDLDIVALDLLKQKLSRVDEDNAVSCEYNRTDRYWMVLYPTFRLFKYHYNGCIERILDAAKHDKDPVSHIPTFITPEELPQETSDEVKDQVKNRDGGCTCCGIATGKLEVDHIAPKHFGGSNILDNLQTLCKKCNQLKGTGRINFRDCQTDLSTPLDRLPEFEMPTNSDAGDPEEWTMFVSRTINFFYKCGAVHGILIKSRGEYFNHWWVQLNAGNDPTWLKPHLPILLKRIRAAKDEAGYGAPRAITVFAPDKPEISYSVRSKK